MAPGFREVLNSGKFIITSEIGPPKGTNFSRRKLVQPSPPFPARMEIANSSTNVSLDFISGPPEATGERDRRDGGGQLGESTRAVMRPRDLG